MQLSSRRKRRFLRGHQGRQDGALSRDVQGRRLFRQEVNIPLNHPSHFLIYLETPSRCFPELGYECRNAFYMPCTPEFDDEGRVTTEDGCPERFKCTRVEFEAGPEKVCVPVQPKEFRAEKCETDFDCGYSVLEGGWSPCGGGRCYRAVEK